MQNLDRFRVVELEFGGVKAMGQGFADEIFRVFSLQYPDVEVHAVNASSAIQAMIQHVQTSGE